jgi:hypothetical protein
MAKVLDVITSALITAKALAAGETPNADMSATALVKFNEVLDALTIQNLAVYSNVETTFPLVGGTATYTIGPTGTVIAQRPPFVDTVYASYQGVDFEVQSMTQEEYALLSLKTNPGIPTRFVYHPEYPNGSLTLWPVPYAPGSLTLYQNREFTHAATIYDTFDMPAGYQRMIRLMLAWELASDYPGLAGDELSKLSEDAKSAIALIKRNNKKPAVLRSEVAQLDCSGSGNYGNWRDGA